LPDAANSDHGDVVISVVNAMSQSELPAEHAILGLLALDEGPGHGYDLARHFAEGQPLGGVLRLEPGMLYHLLKKMARSGWVTFTVEPQGSRPPRQVYQITESGRAELQRWLREPVARTREIRLEFLVKLYFARKSDSSLAGRLLAEQRETCERLEESLASQLAVSDATDASDDDVFTRMVLELRLAQTQAATAWLNRVTESTLRPSESKS
jgi:PadR family transcriptional regulator AphA